MDGVTGTKRWYYTDAEYRVNDYDDNWIYGFAKEDVSVLEENLIAGTVDYNELVSKNGIILINDTAENLSLSAQLGDEVEVDFLTKAGQTITKSYTIMGIVSNFSHPAFNMCFAMPMELMNEACGMDCSGTVSVMAETNKSDTIEASLNQLID